jgi:hypothetical protein
MSPSHWRFTTRRGAPRCAAFRGGRPNSLPMFRRRHVGLREDFGRRDERRLRLSQVYAVRLFVLQAERP